MFENLVLFDDLTRRHRHRSVLVHAERVAVGERRKLAAALKRGNENEKRWKSARLGIPRADSESSDREHVSIHLTLVAAHILDRDLAAW